MAVPNDDFDEWKHLEEIVETGHPEAIIFQDQTHQIIDVQTAHMIILYENALDVPRKQIFRETLFVDKLIFAEHLWVVLRYVRTKYI